MSFEMKYLIYPVRQKCKLVIKGVFPIHIDPKEQYSILITPFSGLRPYGLRNTEYAPVKEDELFFTKRHALTRAEEQLVMDICFPQEDCYICNVYIGEQQVKELEIYALEADLLGKSPFKGDNHMHTYMSDGVDSPAYMAAAACRNGYDYCAITDHRLFEPSVIARDFFKPTGVDFLVILGEEIHAPGNPVHIINLGGNESINDWWRDHEDEYRDAVMKEMKNISENMTDTDRYATAASQVIFDRIREVDGIAVLCHPHWIREFGFNEHEDITDYLFEHKRFDALELIAGGAYEVGTQMQLSYYNNFPNMPVLGNSDAHGCFGITLEPGNYTIVFAEKLEENAIKHSIRSGFTVAADGSRFYGDYRLVKYAYFLERNYFPKHKEIRSKLGAFMLRAASGMDVANSQLGIRPSHKFASLCYNSVGSEMKGKTVC